MTGASPAAYCPECEHLLGNDDVVRIIGRHMDGADPSFRCPACDAEVVHPSRAPDDAPTHEGRSRSRSFRSGGSFEDVERTVVAGGAPPIDLGDAREGDRITLHYRVPDLAALQTITGTIVGMARAVDGSVAVAEVEADTGRAYRFEPGGRGELSADGSVAGRVVRLEVRR